MVVSLGKGTLNGLKLGIEILPPPKGETPKPCTSLSMDPALKPGVQDLSLALLGLYWDNGNEN